MAWSGRLLPHTHEVFMGVQSSQNSHGKLSLVAWTYDPCSGKTEPRGPLELTSQQVLWNQWAASSMIPLSQNKNSSVVKVIEEGPKVKHQEMQTRDCLPQGQRQPGPEGHTSSLSSLTRITLLCYAFCWSWMLAAVLSTAVFFFKQKSVLLIFLQIDLCSHCSLQPQAWGLAKVLWTLTNI